MHLWHASFAPMQGLSRLLVTCSLPRYVRMAVGLQLCSWRLRLSDALAYCRSLRQTYQTGNDYIYFMELMDRMQTVRASWIVDAALLSTS